MHMQDMIESDHRKDFFNRTSLSSVGAYAVVGTKTHLIVN